MEKIKLVIAMLIVGTLGIFVYYIPLPSSVIACSRAVLGAIFLVLVIVIKKKNIRWGLVKDNGILLLLSGSALGFNWIFLFEAYKYTSVAVATLCYYMAPVFVVLLSPFIIKEKLTPIKLGGTFMAIIGAVLISGIIGGSGEDLRGIAFGLAAAILYCSIIIINKLITGLSALEKTFCQLAISAIIMISYVLFTENLTVMYISSKTLLLLLILGIIHTGIVYILFFSAVGNLPAQTSAILSYIDPVTAIILSALFLRQGMGLPQVIGTILILGSTIFNEVLSQKNNQRKISTVDCNEI